MSDLGLEMHKLCHELFPICRSITGDGFRQSLTILSRDLPNLQTIEVSTGTKCFDWDVPKEWNIRDAYIINPEGKKICDFNVSNLYVVGYSTPINETVTLDELNNHLYSLPDQPSAIPYITSYYKERWGFCISQNERDKLISGKYRVFIDSDLKDGSLTYGGCKLNCVTAHCPIPLIIKEKNHEQKRQTKCIRTTDQGTQRQYQDG